MGSKFDVNPAALIVQDSKLHARQWHHLLPLGHLLASLAEACGHDSYLQYHRLELGIPDAQESHHAAAPGVPTKPLSAS